MSKETYHKHIEIVVKDAKDEIYITGNQPALGNWDAGKIKMKHVNDSIRAIDVDLHLPAQFKFTKGSWKEEAIFDSSVSGLNQVINSKERTNYIYKVYEWYSQE